MVLSVAVGPFVEEDDEELTESERVASTTTAAATPAQPAERSETTATSEPTGRPTTTMERDERGRVSQSTFPEPWPLSVDQGTLRCMPGNSVVFVADDGTIYALNGLARGRAEREEWREVDEIWVDNPNLPGTKISIGPLIDLGLDLCE